MSAWLLFGLSDQWSHLVSHWCVVYACFQTHTRRDCASWSIPRFLRTTHRPTQILVVNHDALADSRQANRKFMQRIMCRPNALNVCTLETTNLKQTSKTVSAKCRITQIVTQWVPGSRASNSECPTTVGYVLRLCRGTTRWWRLVERRCRRLGKISY